MSNSETVKKILKTLLSFLLRLLAEWLAGQDNPGDNTAKPPTN